MKTEVNKKNELVIKIEASEIKPLTTALNLICDALASKDYSYLNESQRKAFTQLAEIINL